MNKYTIFYRGCDTEVHKPEKHGRPQYFSKINNFNSVYKNVYEEIINLGYTCDFHVLFDGQDNPLLSHIQSFDTIEVHRIYSKDNNTSLTTLYNIADGLDSENFYFVEDDYLHRPGACKILIEGLEKFGLITLYDHPDRYTRDDDITKGQEEIAFTESSHWRTSESTTNCWAARKDVYEQVKHRAKQWLGWDREFFRQTYLNEKIRLWLPIPGYSSHVHEPYQSPLINWEAINNESI